MIEAWWLIPTFICGMIFLAVMLRIYGSYTPAQQKEMLKQVKETVCPHDYKLVNTTSTDALGQPYGYHHYKCGKCGHQYKKLWYA